MSDDRPLPANHLLSFLKERPDIGERVRAEAEASIIASTGGAIGEAVFDSTELRGREAVCIAVARLGSAANAGLAEKGSGVLPCSMCGHPCVVSQMSRETTTRDGVPLVCLTCLPRFSRRS